MTTRQTLVALLVLIVPFAGKAQSKTETAIPIQAAAGKAIGPTKYGKLRGCVQNGTCGQGIHTAATGAAPVYMYLFTWNSLVMNGVFKSMHCMELPFVFDNISRCEEMTGGGKYAHALADKISRA